jgi:hypothetical protein
MSARHEALAPSRPMSLLPPIIVSAVLVGLYSLTIFKVIETPSFTVLGATLAGIVYLLAMADIRIGICVLILTVGLSPEFAIGDVGNLRAEDFILPVLLVAWLGRTFAKRTEFISTPLKWPIMLMLFFWAASSLQGMALGTVTFTASLFYYGKFVEYILFFLLMLNNTHSEEDAKLYAVFMIIAGTCVGAYGAYEATGDHGVAITAKVTGPYGETSNILGGYLTFHMALTIGLMVTISSMRYRLLLLCCFLVQFYPFIYTFSRTSYIALLAGLAVLGILRVRRLLVFLFFGLFVVPFLVTTEVVSRAASILDIFGKSPPSSWTARTYGWRKFGRKIFVYPILGQGVGATRFSSVDNEYMRVILDTGLIGLILFVWFLFAMLRVGLQTYERVSKSEILSGISLGYVGGLLVLMVHGLGSPCFSAIRTMEPLMLATGLVGALHALQPKWHAEHREREETLAEFRKLRRR